MVKFSTIIPSQMVDEITGKESKKLEKGMVLSVESIKFGTFNFQGNQVEKVQMYTTNGEVYTTSGRAIINQCETLIAAIDDGRVDTMSYRKDNYERIVFGEPLEVSLVEKKGKAGKYLCIE